jgi:hypothetical protein
LFIGFINIGEEIDVLGLEELRIDFIGELRCWKKTFGKLLNFL